MAQRPTFISVDPRVQTDPSRAACDNKAGTSTQTLNATSQSNDKRFLCYKDKLTIRHSKDQTLISDPVKTTPPGVAYLYLRCAPTKTGPTVQDVAADPCILKSPAGATPPGYGFYVETGGNTKGDNEFENDGYWQTNYAAGKPFALHFAPITFDAFDFSVNPPKAQYEGTPSGQCVDVNTAAAFEVVYLNEIKQTILTQGDKTGNFRLVGGFPEYTTTQNYTVTVALKSAPNTPVATISNKKHNEVINFTTPQNGTFTVTVEDGKSCGITFDMVLSAAFDVLATPKAVSCSGGSNGEITLTPSGGTAPYSYVWAQIAGASGSATPTNLPTTGDAIPNLKAGNYSITVTDNTGATKVLSPIQVVEPVKVLTVNVSPTNPSCNDSKDGNMTANPDGGTLPYTYEWNNGEKGTSKSSITGIDFQKGIYNGSYTVTVTDANGCKATSSASFKDLQMVITNVNNQNATCKGSKDGQINFDITGGTSIGGNYNYLWSNSITGIASNVVFFNIEVGKYRVSITDANGCRLDSTFEVKEARKLIVTQSIDDAKCFGQKDGAIAIQVTQQGLGANSVSPMNFAWNTNPSSTNPAITAFTYSASNVGTGTYYLTITDNFNCKIVDTVNVKQPNTALDITITNKKDPTCNGNSIDGEIAIAATGGTAPYLYEWSNNGGNLPERKNLVSGTYRVTVSDANGCSKTANVTLIDPPGPSITDIKVKNVNCFTDDNGSIELTTTKANPADVLTYKWSNGGTTATLNNLKPGAYTVTVSDQKGCAIIRDTIVKSPPVLELVGNAVATSPKCPTSADGTIELEVKGGTAPYTYKWKANGADSTASGQSSNYVIKGLPVGAYDITVTDQNNCPGLVIPLIQLSTPSTITLTKVKDRDVSCFTGKCDGKATLTITAGNSASGNYEFKWQTNAFGTAQLNEAIAFDELCRGWNRVTITDGACSLIDSIFIPSPAPLTYDTLALQVTDVSCKGRDDGAIVVIAKGGVGPYNYAWQQGSTTPAIGSLAVGDYILTITDNKGCIFETTIPVKEPEALIAKFDSTSSIFQTTCATGQGEPDGKLTIIASGGNITNNDPSKNYTYSWSDNKLNGAQVNGLITGTYAVTVSDTKGCNSVLNVSIVAPEPIAFTLDTIVPPLCNGFTTLIKVKTASGGNGSQLSNYTFSVDDGALANVDGGSIAVLAGPHVIKVYDSNKPGSGTGSLACFATANIPTIQEPSAVRVYLGKDPLEVSLGETITIDATVDSEVPIKPNAWIWSATPNSNPLSPSADTTCKNNCRDIIRATLDGQYSLEVENENGCKGIGTLNLIIDRSRNVYLPNAFSPNVDGTNDFFEVFSDGRSVESINYLRVFDRWGTQVFESPKFKPEESRVIGNRWNGYYKDNEANIGTYVYICEVKFIDGVIIVFRGDVTLLR